MSQEERHSQQDADLRVGDHDNAQPTQAEEPSSFFSSANLKISLVNIFGGTLNGYSIGFVSVYSNLYSKSTQCTLYKSRVPCETLSNVDCEWVTNVDPPYCGWKNHIMCSKRYTERFSCDNDKECHWNYDDKECNNYFGYGSLSSGIFATSMIVGCLVGSFFAGPIAKRLGPKLSFFVIGCMGLVSSVLYHISAAADQFSVLCIGRLLVGLALGLVNVACPMYVSERASPKYNKMLGVLYQFFTTFGIFLAALIGLAVGQSIKFDSNSNQHLSGRMQAICTFSTLLSLFMVLLGLFLGGFGLRESKDVSRPYGEQEEEDNGKPHEKQYTVCQMSFRILLGFLVAGTLQLTGINAVMNYAPTIMSSFSLAALVGNFIVMLWNFVTTIISVPLASVLSMRQMFLACSFLTSACCLFLCGIPVYPGVSSKNVKNGVAITGILLFIAFFEFGVGPCFYVLSQDLFPPSFRPKGASFTMVAQFIFNIIINLCYPIATESISGGASGDQDKGQAVAFIFFGCIGLVCFVVQVFFLYPWEEGVDEKEG